MKATKQAAAPKTVPMSPSDFSEKNSTVIRWLGNAGVHINSHGTNLMIDPVLKDFDFPLLIEMPVRPEDVPHLDAVLISHCDHDHFSKSTCMSLQSVCDSYHSTRYVAELCKEMGLKGIGHDINEKFNIHNISITLTPADHAWQNEMEEFSRIRQYQIEDYCGFWLDTPDGSIWFVGDSRLMDNHLHMASPDAILFDFSDNSWHIGLENAIRLANAYPNAQLILVHWGTYDAFDIDAHNANPESLKGKIVNEERIHLNAAGEPFILRKHR